MTITTKELDQLSPGTNVTGPEGSKIGTVGQVYLDDTTGEPSWVTVKTGMFGSGESFVPLQNATLQGEDVKVGYDKAMIKDAPRIDPDGSMNQEEENGLYRYYGLDAPGSQAGGQAAPSGRATGESAGRSTGDSDDDRAEREHGHPGAVGRDTSGPTTDDAMTRSEEELRVGTQTREGGRARLRKHVVTEHVTKTVPVRHEEVSIEREPITDANRGAAGAGPDISEEEHEVTLREEVPTVQKETVAKERVRLGTETVTDQAEVSEDVRKEQIDDDTTTAPTNPTAGR